MEGEGREQVGGEKVKYVGYEQSRVEQQHLHDIQLAKKVAWC